MDKKSSSKDVKKIRPKKKATISENINLLLNMPAFDSQTIEELEACGFDVERINNSMLVAYKFLKNAQKGNLTALKAIVNMAESDGKGKVVDPVKIVDDIKPEN